MRTEIISIGSELLLGQIANTDARYLSQELAKIGIDVFYHTVIGDNRVRFLEALQIASKRSDMVITTGGLGPTMDDITKDVIAEFLKLEMVLHEESLDKIQKYFNSMNRTMDDINIKQAIFPKGATILPNEKGTAPGAIVSKDNITYLILPGPPHELIHMFENYALDYLKEYSNEVIHSRVIKIYGMGESTVESNIRDILLTQNNPTIAPLATGGEMSLRITAKTDKNSDPIELIAPVEKEILNRLGDVVYGYDDDTLEGVLMSELIKLDKTISIAESCTGGLIANLLTNIPGSSRAFKEGLITYSNEAKVKYLNVSQDTLRQWGAVSRQTAHEMIDGLLKATGTDMGIAVTGIAGPDGGTLEKPVGLVYIAVGLGSNVQVNEFHFTGDRLKIKQATSKAALNMARRMLASFY
ncbi:MAG: competence/damage-inducible protein A [Clostridiales bacterium]|nr:competence/damage-inducible protein A [Clostridiales bacterium]